jgi:hypothetical protein
LGEFFGGAQLENLKTAATNTPASAEALGAEFPFLAQLLYGSARDA